MSWQDLGRLRGGFGSQSVIRATGEAFSSTMRVLADRDDGPAGRREPRAETPLESEDRRRQLRLSLERWEPKPCQKQIPGYNHQPGCPLCWAMTRPPSPWLVELEREGKRRADRRASILWALAALVLVVVAFLLIVATGDVQSIAGVLGVTAGCYLIGKGVGHG